MGSLPNGSPYLWVPFVYVYLVLAWGCWLLLRFYKVSRSRTSMLDTDLWAICMLGPIMFVVALRRAACACLDSGLVRERVMALLGVWGTPLWCCRGRVCGSDA